jgi:hypothetical protein
MAQKTSTGVSTIGRDIKLTVQIQPQMDALIQMNTLEMNEVQFWTHIKVTTGVSESLILFPTTSRLNGLLKKKQSVNEKDQKINNLIKQGKLILVEMEHLKKELALMQQMIQMDSGSGSTCERVNWEERVKTVESQLAARAPGQEQLLQDQANANAPLEISRK